MPAAKRSSAAEKYHRGRIRNLINNYNDKSSNSQTQHFSIESGGGSNAEYSIVKKEFSDSSRLSSLYSKKYSKN